MKILATADVHIRNYSKFTNWKGVIPDRLKVNIDLANDIVDLAKSNHVNSIIIAGDLLDVATSPPMVLNVVDEFLATLSSFCPVFLTHGQHDLSTKTVDEYLKQLTSLSIFESNSVKFFHNEVTDLGEVSAFFYGWSTESPEFKDADIFVGHGGVQGSKNVLNYKFQSGYDASYLSKKYKFSIIGDIHQSQIFHNNVLIPGPPIQNSFKDSPETGVWIINTDDWSHQFHLLNSPVYPKFFYVNQKSDIPNDKPDNHHYKLSSQVKHKDISDKIQTSSVALDLWKIIESIITSIKSDKQEALLQVAKNVYDEGISCPISTRFIPQVILNKISIKNFFSIKKLEMEIPEGTISIVGDIGSGKSTFLDAICYGLYGTTTKGRFKDDIAPVTFTPSGDPQIIIDFSIGDILYRIDRSTSHLSFEINDIPQSGSRMSDTQKQIEDVIQLSYAEFTCLVYFSQESGSFFGNLKNDQQMALMSMFLNQQDQYIDKMISSVSVSYKHYMSEILKLEGAINNLTNLNTQNVRRHNEYKSYQVSVRDRQIEILKYSPYSDCSMEVIDLLVQGKLVEAANIYFNTDYHKLKSRLDVLKDKKSEFSGSKFDSEIKLSQITSKAEQITKETNNLVKKIKSYKSGICSECKQSLPIDEVELSKMINDVKLLQKNKSDILSEEEPLTEKVKKLTSHISQYNQSIVETTELVKKCDDLMSKHQKEITVDQAEITVLERSISEYENQKITLETQKQSYQDLYEVYEILYKKVFNDKGLKSRCVEFVGLNLSEEINSLLESIDTDLRLTINTVTYNKSGGLSTGFDVSGNFSGVDIKYRNASGGQKMLIDTTAVVCLYNLLSSMYDLPSGIFGFIAMDESIRYLDSKNIDTVRDIISSLQSRSVFIVSHDEKLKDLLTDRAISVIIEDGKSNYQLM